MIKFVGELRDLASPIVIYESRNNVRKISRISRKIIQELGNYLNIKVFFANEERDLSKQTDQKTILISIGLPPEFVAHKELKKRYIVIEDCVDANSFETCQIVGATVVLHGEVNQHFKELLVSRSHPQINLPAISNVIPIETLRKSILGKPLRDYGFAVVGWEESEIQSLLNRINLFSQSHSSLTFCFAVKPRLKSIFEKEFSRLIFEELTQKIEILDLSSWSDEIDFLKLSREIYYLTDEYSDIAEIIEGLAYKGSINVSNKSIAARSDLISISELRDSRDQFGFYRLSLKDNLKASDLIQTDYRMKSKPFHDAFLLSSHVKTNRSSALIIPADAGFFSIFNTLISIRANWIGTHLFDNLIPDWDVNRIIEFWGTSRFESFCYAGKDEGNVFFKLFESNEFANFESYLELKNKKSLVLHSPNLSADPNLTYVWADRLYRSKEFYSWRRRMHNALMDLQPHIELRKEINNLVSRDDKRKLIGMHVRHPSHAIEQPDKSIPGSLDYIRVTEDLLEEYSKNGLNDVIIFVATDQDSVIAEFRKVFRNQVVFFKDTNRVSDQNMSEFDSLEDDMKMKSGFQVQHMAASKESQWGSRMAREVIRDTWMLSRCDLFLHSVSNIATAVSFINPEIEMLKIAKEDNLQSALERAKLRLATALY